MDMDRFAQIRAAAAKIRPSDLVAAVEKFRKLQADCVPDNRVSPCGTLGQPSANAMRTAHPIGAANAGNFTDQQPQNEIACDLCGKLFNHVVHAHLSSSTDDGSK